MTESNGFKERLARIETIQRENQPKSLTTASGDLEGLRPGGLDRSSPYYFATIGLTLTAVVLGAFVIVLATSSVFETGSNSTEIASQETTSFKKSLSELFGRRPTLGGLMVGDVSKHLAPGIQRQIEQNTRQRAANGAASTADDVIINGINLTALGSIYNSDAMNASLDRN